MPLHTFGKTLRALSFLATTGLACACGAEVSSLVGPWHFSRIEGGASAAPQTVSVPHDWSIGEPREADAASSGGMGFFPTGEGLYRTEFHAPDRWIGQRIFIDFEGVYRNAIVSVNGVELARHASGYTPFSVDATDAIQLGASNRLEVAVNNEPQPNARWYTGSGIYRPVHLRVVDPVHIDGRDIAIGTWHISEDGLAATIDISAAVRNLGEAATKVTLDLAIIDPDGLPVATHKAHGQAGPAAPYLAKAKLAVPHPRLWSLDTPTLYRLVARSFVEGRLTDRLETTFGIRTVSVSAKTGLLLNGEPVALFGSNVHDDNGPLGATDYRDAAFRKARLLKEAGFNAVRTAHNPPSTDFLDACDELGLLVIDESFDGWKKKKVAHDYAEIFDANWEKDLDAMVLRDRRHPSVIMWSIGNEVYERGSESGAKLAAAMRERIRKLDTTRPITAGINGLGASGDWTKLDRLFALLDVSGYNYEIDRHTADHERLPDRVIYSSESYLNDAFKSWQVTTQFPYVIGDFVWSGIDYLGEAGIGRVFPPDETPIPHWEGSHFPWFGAACGDIDITGWRKPISHYRNIVWNRGEKLYAAVVEPTEDGRPWNLSGWATQPMLPSWTWPDVAKGQKLTVEVYSRYPKIRLYLNGKRIGEKPTSEAEQFKAVFEIPYRVGKLEAVGLASDGKEAESFAIETAGPAGQIALTPEPGGADQRLTFVQVELLDANGRWNPAANATVEYSATGPARILAVGSGDLATEETFNANPRSTYQGRALVVIERTGEGRVALTARADGLQMGTIELE